MSKWKKYLALNYLKRKPRNKPGFLKYENLHIEFTDNLSLYYELRDIFESKIYHFKSRNSNPFIIDGGACIGLSILYFKKIFPAAKIVSFEPDPNIYSVLQRNLNRNNVSEVELINAGLGKREGLLTFYPDNSDGGSVMANGNGDQLSIDVKIERLSNYINKPVDLLKLNIEGMEGEVFEEIQEKLHFVDQIIFEYHAFSNLPQTLSSILHILDKNGFRYIVSDATNNKVPIPFELDKEYKLFNLVYARK